MSRSCSLMRRKLFSSNIGESHLVSFGHWHLREGLGAVKSSQAGFLTVMFSSSGPHLRLKTYQVDVVWAFKQQWFLKSCTSLSLLSVICWWWDAGRSTVCDCRILRWWQFLRGPCSFGPSSFICSELKYWANNSLGGQIWLLILYVFQTRNGSFIFWKLKIITTILWHG